MYEVTVTFNNQTYNATYNNQTGYYELELTAPGTGGIYNCEVTFTDFFEEDYEDEKDIQVFLKEQINVKQDDKVFIWIFDYRDLEVKDIVEIADYEINIDEETNASSSVKLLQRTTAKQDDIVAIKKNGNIVYWGIIDNIQNESGKQAYEYTLKYITNMFNEKVCLNYNVEDGILEDGAYIIKSQVDPQKVIDVNGASTEAGANVQLWGYNNTGAQRFKVITNGDGSRRIKNIKSDKSLDFDNAQYQDYTNVKQWTNNDSDAQKWSIEHVDKSVYKIRTFANQNFYLDVNGASPTEGTNIQIYTSNNTRAQKFFFYKLSEEIIKDVGIEDFIAQAINDNFVNCKDSFVNRSYLEVRVKTHTQLQTSVSNVSEGMYNLNTWMTNCTKLYNIDYDFYIENNKLIIEIENKTTNKELIDTQAQAISNYEEVFDMNVVSKVEVLTDTNNYYLYLLNDRTTTTDATNVNRAKGRTERVYVANYEEAEQKALDTIKSNTYNHKITFRILNKNLKIGTPISIKTKESVIYDTYISAITITKSNFIEYTCGNIRTSFTDKLLKERIK